MQIPYEFSENISIFTGHLNENYSHIKFGRGVDGVNSVTFLVSSKIVGKYYLTIEATDYRLLSKIIPFCNSNNIAISYFGTLIVGMIDNITSYKEVNCFWCTFMHVFCNNEVVVFSGLTKIVSIDESLSENVYRVLSNPYQIKIVGEDKIIIEGPSTLFDGCDQILSIPSLKELYNY